ncbi:MAG: hypothetical protein AVDCRST_MAG68-2251, partial [uncultured Gemmatimonadetes bacterium]
ASVSLCEAMGTPPDVSRTTGLRIRRRHEWRWRRDDELRAVPGGVFRLPGRRASLGRAGRVRGAPGRVRVVRAVRPRAAPRHRGVPRAAGAGGVGGLFRAAPAPHLHGRPGGRARPRRPLGRGRARRAGGGRRHRRRRVGAAGPPAHRRRAAPPRGRRHLAARRLPGRVRAAGPPRGRAGDLAAGAAGRGRGRAALPRPGVQARQPARGHPRRVLRGRRRGAVPRPL